MLKLAGETESRREKIEQIFYAPSLKNSGDLETGTKTITATAEASGVGNADYNAALTLDVPGDSRLAIQRIAARLSVTIDSMTAGQLNCRVYVDQQDAGHLLFDLNWVSTGNKLSATTVSSAIKAIIFNALKDGNAHTFYFFFWVDSGNAILSVVQLWENVGIDGGTGGRVSCLRLTFDGLISYVWLLSRQGTGNTTAFAYPKNWWSGGGNAGQDVQPPTTVLYEYIDFCIEGTVSTDLIYPNRLTINLRSEQ